MIGTHISSINSSSLDQLCSKCQAVFPTKPQAAIDRWGSPKYWKKLCTHSESIESLHASKLNRCHLCNLIWEAHAEEFERRLVEEKTGHRRDVRYCWVKDVDKYEREVWKPENRGLMFIVWLGKENQSAGYILWGDPDKPSKDLLSIHFWMTAVSELTKPLLPLPIHNISNFSNSTASPESQQLNKFWVQHCKAHHKLCNKIEKSRSNWNPTRVLDVGVLDFDPIVRLFSPPSEKPITYNTLSHRWGTSKFLSLLLNNQRDLEHGVPLRNLKQTFQDAVLITRRLGVRYLWIDCLCIIQDSKEDWRVESARMGEVYKYGHCNIAAAKSTDDVDEGCYVKRDPLRIKPLIIETTIRKWYENTAEPTQYCINRLLRDCEYVDTASLNLRGWVLQERVMSPRTLHFGPTQIVFECCESKASETWPGAVAIDLPSDRAGLKVQQAKMERSKSMGIDRSSYPTKNSFKYPDGFEYWENVVQYYSDTNVTIGTDRLVAVSGIMKSIQPKIGAEYIAGLWNYQVEYQLLWKAVHSGQCTRPAEYVAPTWSWASVQGQVEGLTQQWTILPHSHLVTVVEVRVQPVADAFGQVLKGGFIKLRGQLTTGYAGRKENSERKSSGFRWVGDLTMNFDTSENISKKEIYWLPILSLHPVSRRHKVLGHSNQGYGLMLLPSDKRHGVFTRCGIYMASFDNGGRRKMEKALEKFEFEAEKSGLPYERRGKRNEFIVTII